MQNSTTTKMSVHDTSPVDMHGQRAYDSTKYSYY